MRQFIPIRTAEPDAPLMAAVANEITKLTQDMHTLATRLDVLRVAMQAGLRDARRPFEDEPEPTSEQVGRIV